MSKSIEHPIRVMRIIARMNVGGPAVQITSLMRGFNSSEFDQRLYTGYCAHDEADYLEMVAPDVKAIRIRTFGRRVNFYGDIRAFFSLVNEIRKFKPHIIHTHTTKAGLLGRFASIFSFHPSIRIHTYHGHLLHGYFGRYKRTILLTLERFLAYFSHQLLAVGDTVQMDLIQAGIGNEKKFTLMPPGLAIGLLSPVGESRNLLGLSTNHAQCAFIGRVTQIKRPDRFLDVVTEIKKRGIDLEFFMAGGGELLEICQERIEKEELPVKTLGWQSNIERVLSACDIVLLTSDNEGTPLSLIQAGMAGIPVVTVNVGAVSEVVLAGQTGIITGLEVEEIANALEKLVNDKDLRKQLGGKAQDFTLSKFGVERLINDHQALYKKLLLSQARF
jgi:glycosyltransferase involved in cell wall biosynthesis